MKTRTTILSCDKNPSITIEVTTGHFATRNSHISHYLDVSGLKSGARAARDAAREMAIPYLARDIVDVIVCMEGTETIAAYLAEELLQEGNMVMNADHDIQVITPMSNVNGQLVFHQNIQQKIRGRNIILVLASVSSGKTVRRAFNCLNYYGGTLVGISAVFSAAAAIDGIPVDSLFTVDNIPGYKSYHSAECKLCKEGLHLDAVVDSEGYTEYMSQTQ